MFVMSLQCLQLVDFEIGHKVFYISKLLFLKGVVLLRNKCVCTLYLVLLSAVVQ